jgi:methionyl-tRNA formyltransferase
MKICLAGGGWGCVSAYKSLSEKLSHLFVFTSDQDLRAITRNSDHLVDGLVFSDYDYVICAGYKEIIDKYCLSKNNVLNIHYSLLPRYRGMHSTVWAMLNGDSQLGLSIHLMNGDIDDGPIVHQYKFNYNGETSFQVMILLNEYVEENLGSIFLSFIDSHITPIEQDKSGATWCCKRNLDDCMIDFNESISFQERFFKALVRPYPLPAISVRSKSYEILEADFIYRDYHMTNGRVVNIDSDGAWIKVADGFLLVKKLLDEKRRAADFRAVFSIGMRLG